MVLCVDETWQASQKKLPSYLLWQKLIGLTMSYTLVHFNRLIELKLIKQQKIQFDDDFFSWILCSILCLETSLTCESGLNSNNNEKRNKSTSISTRLRVLTMVAVFVLTQLMGQKKHPSPERLLIKNQTLHQKQIVNRKSTLIQSNRIPFGMYKFQSMRVYWVPLHFHREM